jgi:hypothetical protein
VWFAGLVWYLFAKKGKSYRALGIIYVSVFALLVISGNARSSYLAPAYPMLFASGALVLERASERVSKKVFGIPLMKYVRGAVVMLILAGGIAIAPLALPVLPVGAYIDYSAALGNAPATEEKHEVAALGQFFADMHGWDEIVATVTEVYEGVKSEDQGKWAVFTGNYGVAGAIDFLGKEYNLPPAISGHNNYWLWGPGDPPPENLIVMGEHLMDHELCKEIWQASTTDCTYCMPYENNNPIFVCRGLEVDPNAIWPKVKHFQ